MTAESTKPALMSFGPMEREIQELRDLLDEGAAETFTVDLNTPNNAVIADGTGLGTITDDEGEPALTINDVTVTEGDGAPVNAVFTVTLPERQALEEISR